MRHRHMRLLVRRCWMWYKISFVDCRNLQRCQLSCVLCYTLRNNEHLLNMA